GQFELLAQRVGGEILIADKADLGDLGDIPFKDIEAHPHPIAWQRRDDGVDLHTILALGQVLLLDFELGPFEHGAIKHSALAEADIRQRLDNHLAVELAHAVEGNGRDGGTLIDHHDENVVVRLDLDIVEEAGGIKPLNRLGRLFFSELVTNLDGQIAEDGAGIDPLDPFYLNILDGERGKSPPQGRKYQGSQHDERCSMSGQCQS